MLLAGFSLGPGIQLTHVGQERDDNTTHNTHTHTHTRSYTRNMKEMSDVPAEAMSKWNETKEFTTQNAQYPYTPTQQ